MCVPPSRAHNLKLGAMALRFYSQVAVLRSVRVRTSQAQGEVRYEVPRSGVWYVSWKASSLQLSPGSKEDQISWEIPVSRFGRQVYWEIGVSCDVLLPTVPTLQ